jgi:hypothetical protein
VARPNNFEMDTTKVYEKALKAEKSNLQYAKAKDDFDRSKQPIPGPINSLKVPEYWTKTLDNNLKMIGTFSEELPLVSIQLAVGAGHVFEPIEKAGIATLTAEMFKESTVNNAGEVLSQALSNMGSRIDVNANSTEIVFNINSLLKNLDSTLAIFKEIFFTPIMDQDEFAKVKNQLLQNISNQSGVAINVCADLQHRRFAVAAGQRYQIRFGHDHGNVHALPRDVFEAEDKSDFFGKWRGGVMVKNHAASDLDNLLAEILAFEQTEKCLGRMSQTLGHGFTRLELSAANQLT